MTQHVVVLDAGNALVKAANAEREISFPHAIKRLNDSEWKKLVSRNEYHDELFLVNGMPFIVGSLAERHSTEVRTKGAARYQRNYYGVFTAISLARLYRRSVNGIFVFGSHAPLDVDYREDLMDAIGEVWEVEYQGNTYHFGIDDVSSFDEPLGGVMNVILTKDGMHFQKNNLINDGITAVFDIGGFTTDGLIVERGGKIDYGSAKSNHIGILSAIETFESAFRSNNRELLRRINKLDPAKVREAIRTGVFDLRGLGKISCFQESEEACTEIVNRVIEMFYADPYGGPANFDNIVLTGGGAALLEERLRIEMNHPHITLADAPTDIHMANVRGGMKLYKMYKDLGVY